MKHERFQVSDILFAVPLAAGLASRALPRERNSLFNVGDDSRSAIRVDFPRISTVIGLLGTRYFVVPGSINSSLVHRIQELIRQLPQVTFRVHVTIQVAPISIRDCRYLPRNANLP
jgi:hypothetical protein